MPSVSSPLLEAVIRMLTFSQILIEKAEISAGAARWFDSSDKLKLMLLRLRCLSLDAHELCDAGRPRDALIGRQVWVDRSGTAFRGMFGHLACPRALVQ